MVTIVMIMLLIFFRVAAAALRDPAGAGETTCATTTLRSYPRCLNANRCLQIYRATTGEVLYHNSHADGRGPQAKRPAIPVIVHFLLVP